MFPVNGRWKIQFLDNTVGISATQREIEKTRSGGAADGKSDCVKHIGGEVNRCEEFRISEWISRRIKYAWEIQVKLNGANTRSRDPPLPFVYHFAYMRDISQWGITISGNSPTDTFGKGGARGRRKKKKEITTLDKYTRETKAFIQKLPRSCRAALLKTQIFPQIFHALRALESSCLPNGACPSSHTFLDERK